MVVYLNGFHRKFLKPFGTTINRTKLQNDPGSHTSTTRLSQRFRSPLSPYIARLGPVGKTYQKRERLGRPLTGVQGTPCDTSREP